MTTRCQFSAVAVLWLLVMGAAFGFYNPQQGRWLSREPLGEGASIGLYSYVHDDPVNRHDYLGLQDQGDMYPDSWQKYYTGFGAANGGRIAGGGGAGGVLVKPAGPSVFQQIGGFFSRLFGQSGGEPESCPAQNPGPTTTLYHGGDLRGGKVQPSRISTTTSPEHAQKYAAKSAGQVHEFEVPSVRLYQMEAEGSAERLIDNILGTSGSALEWRFYGDAAGELNDYRK